MAQKKSTANTSPKKTAKKTVKKPKQSTAEESSRVTRITATDTKPQTKKAVKSTKAVVSNKTTDKKPAVTTDGRRNPLKRILGYLKGSWQELRQVRWTNRRTTWGLTLAVLVFTAFFVALIMLLDYAFQMMFERILG